jgi:hypothetical protein
MTKGLKLGFFMICRDEGISVGVHGKMFTTLEQ